jgi:hypothetical protein
LEKLASLSNSTAELPIRSFTETKFSGRSRLYVGNLGNDIVEQDLKEYFSAYGEIAEVFLNKEKGFAFVRLVSALFSCDGILTIAKLNHRIIVRILKKRSANWMEKF